MNAYIAPLERERARLVDIMMAPLRAASVGDEVLATYVLDGVTRKIRGEAVVLRAPIRVSAADVPLRIASALVAELASLDRGESGALDAAVREVLAELPWSATAAVSSEAPIAECDVAIAERIAQLELIDPLTADHSRAVAAWSRRIAERLGMNRDDALHASRSGLIHDIGKSAIPREILVAPRALGADERSTMEAHAIIGERLVRGSRTLEPFGPAIRNHHERFDGRGYPDGLRGDAILPVTRIVTVADAFNAMIDRRPYRAPRAPSEALLELVRERGGQFDPEIVDAMIAVVEDAD